MAALETLVDTLGRMIEVDTERVDVLKQLADALGAKVGGGGKPTDNPVVAKLQELADAEGAKRSEIKTAIEDLPTDIYSLFSPRATEITEELKKISRELGDIKNNTSGGGGGGGPGACNCATIERHLQSIVTNTATVPAIGGGILAMNTVLQGIRAGVDAVARATRKLARSGIGGGGGGGGGGRRRSRGPTPPSPPGSEDIMAEARSLLGDVDTRSTERTAELMEEIARTVEQVRMGLPGAEEELRELMKKAEGTNTRFEKMWSLIGKTNAEMEVLLNSEGLTDKQADKLAKKYAKLEESLYEISQNERKYGRRAVGNMKRLTMELRDVVHQYNQGAASLEQVEAKQKEVLKTASKIQASYGRWKVLTEAVLDGMLAKNFANQMGRVFRGNIDAAIEWNTEASRFGAIMEGAQGDIDGAKDKYRELLKISDQVVQSTHLAPEILRKEYIKHIKKGTRELRVTQNVIESAAAGAWQIGANAESTADEFQKWNMHIGMSASGSKSLARTMQTVARQTGVMGDNLLQAVEAAREVAQLMKNTGLYSQQTADSVVGWMASAQKFGVDKQVKEIFAASQGGLEAYMNASSEVRNLLASAGQLPGVLKGDADPDKVMAGTKDALQKAIIDAGGGAAFEKDKDGKPIGIPDLKKLDKATISRLDLIMKKRFGMKLGESVRLMEAIRDQNPDEKLADINRQLASERLTKAEKESLELQKQQLEALKRDKELNAQLGQLSELSDRAKTGGKTMDQLLKEMKSSVPAMQANVNSSSQTIADKLAKVGKDFKTVTGMSQQDFAKKMNDAIKNGNVGEFREMNEQLSKANELADSMAKTNSNLKDKVEDQTNRARNQIQNALEPVVNKLNHMPLMLFNLITIAGGIWALYRLFSKNRVTEEINRSVQSLAGAFLHRGSGYTHDIHCEKLLQQLLALMKKDSKQGPTKGPKNEGKTLSKEERKKKVAFMRENNQLSKRGTNDAAEIWKAEKEKMRIQAQARLAQKKALEDAVKAEKAAFDKLAKPFKDVYNYTVGPVVKVLSGAAGKVQKVASDYIIGPITRRLSSGGKSIGEAAAGGFERAKGYVARKAKDVMESTLGKATAHAAKSMKRGVVAAVRHGIDNPVVRTIRGMAGAVAKAARYGINNPLTRGMRGMSNQITGIFGGMGKALMVAGGVIGAVVGVLAMAYQHSEKLQQAIQPLMDAFGKVMGKLGDALAPVVEKLIPIFLDAFETVAPLFDILGEILGLIADILKPFLQVWMEMQKALMGILIAVLKPLVSILKAILLPILKVITPILKIIGTLFKLLVIPFKLLEPLLKIIEPILTAILKPLEWLGDLIDKAASAIDGILGPVQGFIDLISSIAGVVGGAVGAVTGAIGSVLGGAADVVGGIVSGAGDVLGDIADGIGDFFGFSEGGIVSKAGSTVGAEPVPIIAHVGEAILNGEQQNLVATALNNFMGSNLTPTLYGLLDMTGNMYGMMGRMDGVFGGFTGMFDDFLGGMPSFGGGLFDSITDSLMGGIPQPSSGGGLFDSLFGGSSISDIIDSATKTQQAAAPAAVPAQSATTVTVDPQQMANMQAALGFINNFNGIATKFIGASLWGNDFGGYVQIFSNYFSGIGNAITEGMVATINTSFPPEEVLMEANMKLDGMTSVVDKVVETLNHLSTVLSDWVGGWWWNSPIASIGRQVDTFATFFDDIAWALKWGVLKPVLWRFPTPEEVDEANMKLASMEVVVKEAVRFVGSLSEQMSAFTSGWWWDSPVGRVGRQVDIFADYFDDIAWALKWGVLKPVLWRFPTPEEVDEANLKLAGMESVVSEAVRFIGSLSEQMSDFTSGWWWDSPIAKIASSVGNFSAYFSGIATAIRWGVVYPILDYFPKTGEVDLATMTIEALDASMRGLYDALSMLSGTMGEITSVGIDFSSLENVGGIFRAGQFELQLNAKEQEGDGYSDYWDRLLGIFTGVRSPRVNIHSGLLGGMTKGFGDTLDGPVGAVSKGVTKVGKGMSHAARGIDRVGDETVKVHSGFDKFGTGLEQWQNRVTSFFTPKQQEKPQAGTGAVGGTAAPAPTKGGLFSFLPVPSAGDVTSFLSGTGLSSLADIVAPHVDAVAAAVAPDVANANVATPATNKSDFDEQVRAKVETARPGAAMTAASDQLAEIAANTAASVEELKEVNENLVALIGVFSGDSGGEAPNTKPKSKPRGTPNYYTWQFGRFGDTAAKQHNNPGT